MLESLDAAVFAAATHAYGPAVDVPGALACLARGDREESQRAIGGLIGSILHQGTYYEATALAVPFLIEIAAADLPARADVFAFLAMLAGAPDHADEDLLGHEDEDEDDGDEDDGEGGRNERHRADTFRALCAGRATFEQALRAASPAVRRGSAHLIALIGAESSRDALERALSVEEDELTRVALRFAMGNSTSSPARPGLERHVALVLADGPLEGERQEAFRSLLSSRRWGWDEVPFERGNLGRFATRRLLADHAGDPCTFDLLEGAYRAELSQSENPGVLDLDRGARREALLAPMLELAFGPSRGAPGAPTSPLLQPSALSAQMRTVLALCLEGKTRFRHPSLPCRNATDIRRFLSGGPLDRVVELDGSAKPAFDWLVELVRTPWSQEAYEKGEVVVDRVFAQLARGLDAHEAFDLACDALSTPYGIGTNAGGTLSFAVEKHVVPLIRGIDDRLETFARELVLRADHRDPDTDDGAWSDLTRLAVRPWRLRKEAPSPELDILVRSALRSFEEDAEWLRAFPEPRRSRLVAESGFSVHIGVCEPATFEEEVIRGILESRVFITDHLLEPVPNARLEELCEALPSNFARDVRGVLQQRTLVGLFSLRLEASGDEILLALRDWKGILRFQAQIPAAPLPEDLRPVVDATAFVKEPTIEFSTDLAFAVSYRVQRVLLEAGLVGTVRNGSMHISSVPA